MQTSLSFITPNTFKKVKERYARIEESKTNKYIAFLINRNRGLKGEITKIKKKI